MLTQSLLLASGGMDSTVLAFWLLSKKLDVRPLFIDYGQHCSETELSTLRRVLPDGLSSNIEVINVSDIYRFCDSRLIVEPNLWEERVTADDLYIPYRNLLLLSIGAAVAQARGIPYECAAFINSNHAKEIDCSHQFFSMLTDLLAEFGRVEVRMPFRYMSKTDVAQLGVEVGAPIAETFSCQANSEVHCGVCPNCVDRITALSQVRTLQNENRITPEEM